MDSEKSSKSKSKRSSKVEDSTEIPVAPARSSATKHSSAKSHDRDVVVPDEQLIIAEMLEDEYRLSGIPKTIQCGLLHMCLHMDFHASADVSKRAAQTVSTGNIVIPPHATKPEAVDATHNRYLQIPVEGNRVFKLIAVGCSYWNVTGNVSIGISIPKVKGTVMMNNTNYVMTLPMNGESSTPRLLYRMKPDKFVRKMFPMMTVDGLHQGVIQDDDNIALPLEKFGSEYVCPAGIIIKKIMEISGDKPVIDISFKKRCLLINLEQYQSYMADLRSDIADSGVELDPKTDKISFTPSNATYDYHASIILDVVYSHG